MRNEKMKTFVRETLAGLETRGLTRRLRCVSGGQGRKIIVDGQEILNFCSNNYLGLANDPRLQQAALDTIAVEGVGSGAARLVCGNLGAFSRLEEFLAKFKGTEKALVFNSGYAANTGIIPALFGRGDIVFCDRLNHASIIDGIQLSQAECKRYPHRDVAGLENMLRETKGYGKKGIITDTVFSMDGDVAPLPEIVELARKYDCSVMVDEAHALGVLGKTGRGAVEHFGLEGQLDIQMGTLSKAVGAMGAYACGSAELIEFLLNKSRSFIYTTAMPPAIAAAAQKGLEIIADEPALRQKLWDNTNFLLREIRSLGLTTNDSATPIIPVVVGEARQALEFSQKLFEAGIFVSAIRPPTVPEKTARLRITVMATHTRQDLEYLLEQLRKIGRDLCLL